LFAEETTNQGAQTPPAAQAPPVFQPLPSEQPPVAAPAALQVPSKKGDVRFNFDDADLFEVIQSVFGDILHVNYMVDPKVKGRVNFRTVTPVSKEDVLPLMGVLLKMNGAGYVDDKGLYRILPLNEIPGTAPKVFVYPLQNTKAKHIATLLQSIFTSAAAPSAPGKFIPQAPAGPGAAPASSPEAPKEGAGFSAGTGGLVAKETKVYADEITNSLVILAAPDDYKFIEETIEKLDTPPRQVMIEVLIAEVTLTKEFQFGLEWVLSNTTKLQMKPFSRPIDLNGQTGVNSNLLNVTPLSSGYSGFSYAATDIAGNVKALLNTMASNDLVTVLASPHIIAADNLEAKIQIGNQVPIATSQMTNVASSTTTGSILSTIQYQDVGTILKVKPQINESGVVALEVSQEVSDYTATTVLGTQQFIFTKRAAQTNVVANDGQTIVIGGLIQDNQTKNRTGVPVLSSIPVLGYLFGSTDNTSTKTEIIVLLTPHVIRNQQDAGRVTTEYLNRLKGDTKNMKLNEYIKTDGSNTHGAGDGSSKEPAKSAP
jgi:general secretion pathway protein D